MNNQELKTTIVWFICCIMALISVVTVSIIATEADRRHQLNMIEQGHEWIPQIRGHYEKMD